MAQTKTYFDVVFTCVESGWWQSEDNDVKKEGTEWICYERSSGKRRGAGATIQAAVVSKNNPTNRGRFPVSKNGETCVTCGGEMLAMDNIGTLLCPTCAEGP